jgi:hypothetical protein
MPGSRTLLTGLGSVFNEMVVDGRGNAYVNGEIIALVIPDGQARPVAGDIAGRNQARAGRDIRPAAQGTSAIFSSASACWRSPS